MKTKVRFHKLTAWLLTLAMLMTFIPSFTLTASAAEGTDGNVYEQMLEFIVPENNYGIGDIPENRIFHAWGWSYQNIKTRLETIAEQGFSTILVSPPNEIKMPTKYVKFHEPEINGISPNGWWMLYQPAGFQINESGDNALGTKSEFVELCEDAHTLGLKIMVEAVVGYVGTDDDHVGEYDNESNEPTDHVSPRVAEFEPELLADEEAFHFPWVNCTNKNNYRDGYNDYDIEEDLTQHAVDGKPDLATEEQVVQDAIYDYFVELTEAGADGFYFNDAKHIETASDTFFASDFWQDTFVKVKDNYPDKNLQAVAELIGGSGDGRGPEEYLQYGMNLTHTAMSDSIRDGVVNGTDITAAFDEHYPQENSVLWGESYKSYANGDTSALTSEQRAKIWALTISRKGVKGIYLARPSDTLAEGKSEVNSILSTITLGEGNVTDWSTDVIKRINNFAGFFEDTDENVHYDNGIAVIERDGKGAVLVNMQGKETAISLSENSLIDGEYTDAITENKFTVENGKITGEIGESGIAVLYLSEDISIFNLRVGGEQVTSRNLVIDENDNSDITSGSATYDPHSNTLTLNNFTYSGDEDTNNVICYTSSDDLKLVIEGTNSIICTNDRLLVVDVLSNMEISGNGSLSITGGDYGMNVMGSMTVTSGSLSANGGNYGVNTMSGITVSGGSLSATGGRYGVNTISGITVSGGSLSANGGSIGVNTLGEITISGGETVAKGATNAFSKAPTISDTFNNAVVWYGESEDAANEAGAKDISELADNYNQKYIKVAEDAVVPVHSITVTTPEHGTVTADKLTASEGETVTLTVTPAENYDIDTVTYNDGISDVEITATGGVYSFTMPASFVTVYATFVKSSTEVQFEVVKEINDWNAEGSFTFNLQAVTAGAPMPANTSAVATKDMPSARFEAIIYDEMGTYVYTIREVQGSVPGMTYDTSAHEVVVNVTKGEDNKLYATVTYDGEDKLIITNTYTPPQSVRISAVDVADYGALEYAILRIVDDSGDVVEEWVSGNEPHFVEGLRGNQTYTLHVFLPPDGYTVPDDADFVLYESGRIEYGGTTTTDDDGNVILLVAFNKTKAHISATDMDGDEALEGATIQIINEDGYIVEEWVSFQEPRFVEGLKTNETYTLHVARPPAGYIVPADTTFSIDEKGRISYSGTTDTDANDNTVLLIKHEISKVRISAVDMEDGSALADATLQIIDDRGNLVEEWVSHGGYQEIKGLNVDEAFTLHAETAPNGFTKFNDVTFKINKKGELVTAGMVTEDGVLLAGFAPIGFTIKAEHTFDVETRGDITVQVLDSDSEVVAARTLAEFTDRKWKLEGLPADEDYTVRVKDVPWGYAKPADIHVFIGIDGNVTVNGAQSADGVVLITFEEISPVIEEIVFDSDNEVYDAQTNTFYYDAQHLPRIVINGQDLLGQEIYLGLENSDGNHLGFYDIAEDDTGIFMPLNKAILDETFDIFALEGRTADIVKIRAEITGSPDAPTYLELNVKPRKYSITLDSNGADTASVTLDTDYRKLTSLPTPERVGYAFNGWFDARTGGNEITTDTVFEQDTTIYAQWTKLIPKITGIAIDATSSAYDAATDTFTVFKDKPFVAFLEGENFINIDDEFLENNAFGFVPSVEDSENALCNALAVFKDAGFVTIDAVENRIKLTFDYDAMKTFIAEHGSFEGICYGDIVNIKEENIESVNIALAKYDPIYTEPTVKTGLVYNGAEQELLIPGTAEGGTMKYYIGGTQATAEVPTRKAAGEYTVTCIIAGDQFHNNIVVGEYTVSIAKKTIDNAISLTAPVKNAAPQTEITGSCYTATVTWSPEVTDKFGYNTEYTATVTITPDENHTVAGVATNGYTVEGAKTVTNDENSNIVTVAYEKTGSKPSIGGGGSSNTTTTTTKNEDGSTTKVTENKTTGTKTEVTTNTDGSTTTVETKKDGTVTTTEKDKDGNTTTTVEKSDGTSTTTEKNKDGSEKVTEEKADGTTVTTEKDTDGTKTVTTENADGSTTTEEVRKDGTEVKTETTTDGETTAEVKADGKAEVTIPVPDTEKVQMVVVTDENGNNTYITEVETNDNGVTVTTDGNATVSVMSGNKKEFVDVHHVDHWSEKSVDFVHILGLMNGTSENHFSPDVHLTRAMLVTVLYRAEGEPEITNDKSFVDVENGSYYEKAVAWAKANGIVNGTSATTFEPNVSITREQIAAIMHRYADFKGHDVQVGENTNILSYDDVHHVSEYAIGAMQYAVGSGLIKGKTESTLNPLDNATRAEAAAIIERFIKAN